LPWHPTDPDPAEKVKYEEFKACMDTERKLGKKMVPNFAFDVLGECKGPKPKMNKNVQIALGDINVKRSKLVSNMYKTRVKKENLDATQAKDGKELAILNYYFRVIQLPEPEAEPESWEEF
jgi:hypothetical protein